MIKHLFKVSGLDAQGEPFMGSCVASDIIDAINMFREKNYSPHEIKQDVQMPADHPCLIVCLQGAEESFVVAQSNMNKNLRDMQLYTYLKSKEKEKDNDNDKNKTKCSTNKSKEFPEYIGKPLRELVKDRYPKKVDDTYVYGVCGCPHHYTLFSRDYCLCDTLHGKCLDCWNQIYTGYHKEG